MFQLELFASEHAKIYHDSNISYVNVAINDVTFLDGMKESIHRWFRLTPSYSPELVRFLLKHLDCKPNQHLCDPFLGKGTTLIESQKMGFKSTGIEINPLLKRACENALVTWDVSPEYFDEISEQLVSEITRRVLKHGSETLEAVLDELKIDLPQIHNVFRWWKPEVLKELLIVRESIKPYADSSYRLFWMALTSTVIDCANIHRNHPTITFDDHHTRRINVLETFEEYLQKIKFDLKSVQDIPPSATVIEGDSTKLGLYLSGIDRVITSPPYPNRFSYVHTTRPQLFFMEIFSQAEQSAMLDCSAIGGTWGKATSVLYEGRVSPLPEIASILKPLEDELRPKSNLMCNYAIKYFNMMFEHIQSLYPLANKGFKGAYVVGNSRLSGVEVHTDVLLARLFEVTGFQMENILILRKRGGRKKLYETVVCFKKD